ncbi:MAG: hypothetical protein HRU28_18870 [Rhizobiales bacterium]|nr:hypothetical protein [Hyphomicrobiales bacterium]
MYYDNFGFDGANFDEATNFIFAEDKGYSLVTTVLPLNNSKEVKLIIAVENTNSLVAIRYFEIGSLLVPFLSILIIAVILYLVIKRVSTVLIKSSEGMAKLAQKTLKSRRPFINIKTKLEKLYPLC